MKKEEEKGRVRELNGVQKGVGGEYSTTCTKRDLREKGVLYRV